MGHVPRPLLFVVAVLLALCVAGGFLFGLMPSLKRGPGDEEQAPAVSGAPPASSAAPAQEATPLAEPRPPPPKPKAPAAASDAPPSDLGSIAPKPLAIPPLPPESPPGAPPAPTPPPQPRLPSDLPPV